MVSTIPVFGLEKFCPRKFGHWPWPWPQFFWLLGWPRTLCPRLHLCLLPQIIIFSSTISISLGAIAFPNLNFLVMVIFELCVKDKKSRGRRERKTKKRKQKEITMFEFDNLKMWDLKLHLCRRLEIQNFYSSLLITFAASKSCLNLYSVFLFFGWETVSRLWLSHKLAQTMFHTFSIKVLKFKLLPSTFSKLVQFYLLVAENR